MDFEGMRTAAQSRANNCHIEDRVLDRLVGSPTRVESHAVTLVDGWLRTGSPLISFENSFSQTGRISRGDLL